MPSTESPCSDWKTPQRGGLSPDAGTPAHVHAEQALKGRDGFLGRPGGVVPRFDECDVRSAPARLVGNIGPRPLLTGERDDGIVTLPLTIPEFRRARAVLAARPAVRFAAPNRSASNASCASSRARATSRAWLAAAMSFG